MMARTQITMEPEVQRKARRRADEMGVSFAEYVRRLVAQDLAGPRASADPSMVFDLGRTDSSDIAHDKDAMIVDAFTSIRRRSRR